MEQVLIRKVFPQEVALLQRIGRQTFFDTFAANNKEEDLRAYLDESFALEKLATEIATPGSAFYFGLNGDEVVGYIKINTGSAQSKPLGDEALELERIYVLQDFQGQGVGSRLFQYALNLAKEMDASFIWLGVWTKNLRAIAFYQKQGFLIADTQQFILGSDIQIDYLLKLPLR